MALEALESRCEEMAGVVGYMCGFVLGGMFGAICMCLVVAGRDDR